MSTFKTKVAIQVFLKREVLDPEVRAIQTTVDSSLTANLTNLRICKQYELEFNLDEKDATSQATKLAELYLANPVSQSFEVKVLPL